MVLVALWAYLLSNLVKDKHWSSTCMVTLGLVINVCLNIFWLVYQSKKVAALDQGYAKYKQEHRLMTLLTNLMSLVVSFQLFRVQYSRLFGLPCFSMQLELKQKFYTKLNRYTLL
jgi:hypothetical protein